MVGNIVKQKGPDKGLYVMFERTTCSYQLFERINIKEGERSFPCPYKGVLENCKKYLGGFTIEWKDYEVSIVFSNQNIWVLSSSPISRVNIRNLPELSKRALC